MMTTKRNFSDEELSSYLDGEAESELTAAIKTARSQDAAIDARLKAFEAATVAFREDHVQVLKQAPEAPDIPASEPNVRKSSSMALVACVSMLAGALLMLGAFIVWHPEKTTDWRDVVANYQSLYVTETLTATRFTQQEQNAMLARIGQRFGYDFSSLPVIDGYQFTRAQELGFEGQPLAQLTFLASDTVPIALCVIKLGEQGPSGIVHAEMHGLDVYSWRDGEFALLLVGPKGDTTLSGAAKTFKAALTASEI